MDTEEKDLVVGYREENELLRIHLNQLQVELENYDLKLLDEKNKRREMEKEWEKITKEVEKKYIEARKKIDSIRSSRSWKLTRPLRALTSVASKLKG